MDPKGSRFESVFVNYTTGVTYGNFSIFSVTQWTKWVFDSFMHIIICIFILLYQLLLTLWCCLPKGLDLHGDFLLPPNLIFMNCPYLFFSSDTHTLLPNPWVISLPNIILDFAKALELFKKNVNLLLKPNVYFLSSQVWALKLVSARQQWAVIFENGVGVDMTFWWEIVFLWVNLTFDILIWAAPGSVLITFCT